ncbi:TVP38/TMEM64 family protein [Ureibacillus chungkukjangi]|uniref:TVP38/TMEM64 family membrane protein n=1 Tax=Ureibacillus chungkukjangi TaxID=1202712 RepID=A0A318TS38_9BACL|nr:TVP38/TMEM64 family protein [Ureibacillus chungkukjangi]MCM3386514.1 TVP38/TMEM64 family protein [Ureibacillus chungkukjangi]PYF07666.1 putative membrane protein YdjX (TVP38/TMEM64 family) [Ureibacillus chungkukjangi]
MNDFFTVENIENLAAHYRTLGPLIGILLPFIEAFLPFLPLVVIVVANASSYGLWIGFLLSWIGTVLGSYVVFLLTRRFGKHPRLKVFIEKEKVQKLIKWVDMRGLSPLFILLCFPFTPSVLVNIVAGLSNIKKKYYLIVVMAGKFIMIASMSVLGYDLKALITDPVKLIIAGVGIFLLWIVGKGIEKHLNKKVEKDLKSVANKKNIKMSVKKERLL